MMLFKVVLGLGLMLICSQLMAEDDGHITLMLECSKDTLPPNRVWLVNKSPLPGVPGKMCGDKSLSMKSIYIEAIDLRQAPSLSTYALFATIDGRRATELYEFSKAIAGRVLLVAKGDEFVYDGIVGAPMRNGVIFIGVPDMRTGELVGNKIFGKKGVPSE